MDDPRHLLPLLLLVFPILWGCLPMRGKYNRLFPVNSDINKKIFIIPIILLVILLLVFQLVLAKGVEM